MNLPTGGQSLAEYAGCRGMGGGSSTHGPSHTSMLATSASIGALGMGCVMLGCAAVRKAGQVRDGLL